jgi:hypothetical protein
MASKKRTAKAVSRKQTSPPNLAASIFSTAIGSLINMTVIAITFGAVLLCLFAAKRFS